MSHIFSVGGPLVVSEDDPVLTYGDPATWYPHQSSPEAWVKLGELRVGPPVFRQKKPQLCIWRQPGE